MTRGTKEERSARYQLNKAVMTGDLVRPDSCEQCGRVPPRASDIHGHHDDYSKPLSVRWLCAMCHMRIHGAVRRGKPAPKRSRKAA